MPNAVRMFAWLFYGSLVLGHFGIVAIVPMLLSGPGIEPGALDWQALLSPPIIMSSALPAVLVWLAAWKRQNWARIVLAAMFGVGVASLFSPALKEAGGLPFLAFLALQTLLQGAGLACAFSAAARPWFAKTPPA